MGRNHRAYPLRYVIRRLARAPLVTTVSVVTLALGIGANIAIFSVVHGVLLEPLSFEEPERLVGLWHRGFGADDGVHQSPATYLTYREENRVFEDVGMWDNRFVAVTGLAEPERVEAIVVTDGTLPLLRATPEMGRLFTAADDASQSPETVILGFGFWQSRFAGDRDVLGRTLDVDSRPREIIGVLPRSFRFLDFEPAVWLPFRLDPSQVFVGDFSYQALARLARDATLDSANADVARMIPLITEKFPRGMTLEMLRGASFGPKVTPLKRDVVGDVGRVLWVLFGTVGLVLLIACANVANLFLVRVDGRQQEIAIRTAMGASTARLVREQLTESVTLGALGGLVGTGIAYAGIEVLVAVAPEGVPRLHAIDLDAVVLAFGAAISAFAGLVFGFFPCLKYAAPRLDAALKEGGRAATDGKERHGVRRGLVVAQIGLALVLLVGAGLMIRTFRAMRAVQPGFVEPAEVLTLKIRIPEAEVDDREQTARAHLGIKERLEQIPGVSSVGLSTSFPMDGWNSADGTHVEGFPVAENEVAPVRRYKWISEDYFETMGNPVIAGRAFSRADVESAAPVAVVTEDFAEEYWGDAPAAIGKRLRESPDSPWREIVGVVGNVYDDGVAEAPVATVYWPLIQRDFWGDDVFIRRTMGYAVRSPRVGSPTLFDEIRTAVWSVNGNLPIAGVYTLDELFQRSMGRTAFTLVMLAIASAVALLLGVVGVYGVMSYAVTQRTREIGVRMALGAARSDVSRLVVRDGASLVAVGLAVGLTGAAFSSRLMSALVYGVDPVDPWTYLAVAIGLGTVALLASYLPARRAARVHPIDALRWE